VTITLRPVAEADLPLMLEWRLRAETDDPFDFFGHRGYDLVARWAQDMLLGEHRGTLVVDFDGVAVGEVSWHPVRYGPPPESLAYDIGIGLDPAHRGRGHGTAAQRALAEYLFAVTTVHRVQASTDVENVAEQRSLEKAGFAREGVLRGTQWRNGAWHDLVGYARLRGDA
jgi:RimJ/RimL family protein N-acetyltransferase